MNNAVNKTKILLIDADEVVVEQFKNHLKENSEIELIGFVQDGKGALDKICAVNPDVIVMDLILPNTDGISLLENLASIPLTKEPFIIITSSITFLETINDSFRLGADYYIMKPYSLEYVCRRILHIVKEHRKIKPQNIITITAPEVLHNEDYAMIHEVTQVLLELGIPTNVKGYQYVREGILIAIRDISMLHYITKCIYPSIALKYDATPGSVERAIRNAIEICFTRGGGDILYKTFGNAIDVDKGKVTNSEFIGVIADKLRLQHQLHI